MKQVTTGRTLTDIVSIDDQVAVVRVWSRSHKEVEVKNVDHHDVYVHTIASYICQIPNDFNQGSLVLIHHNFT